MDNKKWINKWICHPYFADLKPIQTLHKQLDDSFVLEKHREDLKNFHTLFRKVLYLNKMPQDVSLDISADDYYKLYINGTYVTQGPASSYAFCYNYNHIDITGYLHEGENVLAVHVYYQGLINRAYNSGDYRQGMIAEVWGDGELLIDDSWKCSIAQEYEKGNLIAYDTQYGEFIDNRRKKKKWKEIGYDDSEWEEASVKQNDDHILTLQQTPNLQMEQVYPVEIKKVENGILLDFGRDLTGTLYLKAEGKKGDSIRILFGEELETENSVRNHMRCNCCYDDELILDEGVNELEQFEYKCYRYVQIIASENVRIWGLRTDYRHYPFPENDCTVKFKNEFLNRVWIICKNAVENCAQEAFLDCPHREKGQYLGDLLVTGHAFYYLTGDTLLFKKALQDFANSTKICKGMMAVAPGSFMQEIADFSLLYPYELLLYYQLSGDRGFLEKVFPAAVGIENYFDGFQNESGMIENVKTKWNLVDWPENLRDHYDFDLSQPVPGDGCHNVINALYVGMKKCMEEIRTILNIPFEAQSEKLKESFIRTFFRPKAGLFVDSTVSEHYSLHANIFPAFYRLQPKKNRIAEFVEEKGFSCGVFVAYFVLYGLIRMGRKDLAYQLLTNKTEHSWYEMLKEGATSAFEAWGKEQKWNTSLCHAWASAPIPVLMEHFPELRITE